MSAYEYERAAVLVPPGKEKQIVAVPVPSGGLYVVTAKAVLEHRKYLGASCSLSVLGAAEGDDDTARAVGEFEPINASSTVFLQEIYRIPPRSQLTIFRVRCRNLLNPGFVPNAKLEITNASIQALRIPYAPK